MDGPTIAEGKRAIANGILNRFREMGALALMQGTKHVATVPVEVVSESSLSVVIKVDTQEFDGRGGYRYFTISVKETM